METIEQRLRQATQFRREHGVPLVTLSYAQSLDGSLSGRPGQPLELSGSESARMTHRLRSMHAGILVGIGTLLADDPRLTAREVPGESPQPVVIDSHLRMPLDARVFAHPKGVWIATRESADPQRATALEKQGARLFRLPEQQDGRLDLSRLLGQLAEAGMDSLMVEGGTRVIASFLADRLAHQVVITLAPVFVGGLQVSLPVRIQPDFPRLLEAGMMKLGEDFVIWGRLV